MLRNRTPHSIIVVDPCGGIVLDLPPEGRIARVEATTLEQPPVDGVPVVRTTYGTVTDLDAPEPGVYLVVATLVLQTIGNERPDLLAPDTGPQSVVRDAEGRILGVQRLQRLAELSAAPVVPDARPPRARAPR